MTTTTTIRNTALAALLAIGTAAAAAGAAQAHTVDATSIPGQAAGATGNVVGKGIATLSGGGDDRVIEYGMGGAGSGSAGNVRVLAQAKTVITWPLRRPRPGTKGAGFTRGDRPSCRTWEAAGRPAVGDTP